MAFYDKFPYTNFQEINLDRIIKELMQVKEGLNFVIENASLKYADPIEWNITKQYQANTVVIDPATGIAYISTKPVPNNILISNTNYWTKIFDLSQLFDDLEASIASEAEARESADTTLTEAIQTETAARENADTVMTAAIQAETAARENADNTLQSQIDTLSGIKLVINVKDYGAAGDGVTIDTAALNRAFAAVTENELSLVYFPPGVYLIDNYIEVKSNTYVLGAGATVKINRVDNSFMHASFTLGEPGNQEFTTAYNGVHDVLIDNIIFDGGYNTNFTGSNNGGGNVAMAHCQNITIRNCTFKNMVNDHCIDVAGCQHVIIDGCLFKDTHVLGTNDYEAINIDSCSADGFPHFGYPDNTGCRDINITNCTFQNLKTYASCIGTHWWPAGAPVHRVVRIVGNTVRECSALVRTRYTFDMLIANNDIWDCGYYDNEQSNRFVIYGFNCPGVMVNNNQIRDIHHGGIKFETRDNYYVTNTVIQNNVMHGVNSDTDNTYGHAVRIVGVENVMIQGNIIRGNSRVVSLETISGLMFQHNTYMGSFNKPFRFDNITNGTVTFNRTNTTNPYEFANCTNVLQQGNSETALTIAS